MSRIGNKHIVLPENVTVEVNGNIATVKGPKGSLNVTINEGIVYSCENNVIVLTNWGKSTMFDERNKLNKTTEQHVLTYITQSLAVPKVIRKS